MERILAVSLSLFLASAITCSDDAPPGPPPELTPAEARERIQTSLADLNDCFRGLRDGLGVKTVVDLLDLRGGESEARWWLDDMVDALWTAMDLDAVERASRFDFSTRTGIYSWVPSSYTWVWTPANNVITLQFPESRDFFGNNLELSLTSYQDAGVTLDGEAIYLPTALTLALRHDGQSAGHLAWNVTYDELADFPVPLGANIELFFAPFLFAMVYDRPDTTRFIGVLTATAGGCVASLDFDVTLEHDDYQLFDPEHDFDHVTATLTFNALKIVADVDAHSLSAIGDPTATEINAFVDADVFWGEEKIAEVVARDPTGQEPIAVVVYSDGTEEEAEVLYGPFLDMLEVDFAAYFGLDWLW